LQNTQISAVLVVDFHEGVFEMGDLQNRVAFQWFIQRMALCVISMGVVLGSPAYAQDRECRITAISGGFAVLKRDGVKLRKPVGEVIQQGDVLNKSSSTQLSITCSDQSEITIGRATLMDLGAVVAAPLGERRVFRVLRGIAGFVMPNDGAPVEVRTLNAVASVRSTEWTVEVDGDVTHVFVRGGVVQVTGSSGEAARLSLGEGVTVVADGTLGPVKSWGQGRIDGMNERLGGNWR
jgi:ferric-dicitrate binding protein FerR (iron transport regulator)